MNSRSSNTLKMRNIKKNIRKKALGTILFWLKKYIEMRR